MYGNSGQNNMEYNSGSNYMNYTNGSGQQNSGNQVYNTSLHNNSQTYLNRSEPVQQQSPYSSSATPLSSSQLYLNQQHPQQQPQQQQQQQPQQQQQHNLAGSGMENYTGNVYHTYGEQQQQQAAQSSHAGPQFDESNVAQQHQKFYAQQVQQSAEPHLNGSHANKTDVAKGTNTGSNYMYFERRPDLLSKSTQEKAAAVKLKIENFYQTAVNFAIERNQRRIEFENNLQNHYQDWSDERKYRELTNLGKKESHFLRLRRTRLSLDDFKTVKVIGKGAFGEVRLVQKKDTGKIYAMKTLLKSEMYKKDQLAHVKAERDVLAGADSPWVVSLYYSFQDTQYLYLIMEFLPGGDLMTMLIRWQIFTEDVTRFYMAECILAIEAIHKLGFIHRDIKPDNILIDIRGHIKLSDFGLSTGFHKTHDTTYYKKLLQEDENSGKLEKPPNPHSGGDGGDGKHRNSMMVDAIHLTMTNRQQMQTWRKSRRLMAYSTVGTPDYIAPEIFLYQGYGQECDWWSLGAIMYECLIGWPPFCSETPQETYRKIMNFEKTLQFPDDIHISYEAEDFIKKLLTHADQRLGRHGGAEDLKKHPFFRGVDWNTIRQVEAPYIPKLSSITDTRFFPTDELENVPDSPAMALAKEQQQQQMMTNGSKSKQPQQDLPFIGYTYSRFDYLTTKNVL